MKINLLIIIFLAQQFDNENDKEWLDVDRRWAEQQRIEFHEMDEDKDGILSRDELLVLIHPHLFNSIEFVFRKHMIH
jgi:hypothetical protein